MIAAYLLILSGVTLSVVGLVALTGDYLSRVDG